MRCLVDLDGVLVDLLTGWCRHNNFTIPDPYPFGTMRFDQLFDVKQRDIWKGCGVEFWASLPKMHDASLIMSNLEILFERRIFLITTIIGPSICAAGKIEWVHRNFPKLHNSYFITRQRTQLANEETILIDDDDAQVAAFQGAGGHAVLVPRIWNSAYHSAHESALFVIQQVAKIVRAEQYQKKSF